jgi:hypothetical protein
VGNSLPLSGLIAPAVGAAVTGGRNFAGFPASSLLVGLTAAALLLAVLNHWYGVRRSGSGLAAADHIHYALPVAPIYAVAEKGHLDPYFLGRWVIGVAAVGLNGIDRAIDWVYESLAVKAALGVSWITRAAHNGNVNRYVLWSLAGAAAIVLCAVTLFGGAR